MADRKVFTDSIVPLPDHSGVTPHGLMVNLAEPSDPAQPLPLLFSLGLAGDKQAELEAAIAAGKTLDRQQVAEGYGPAKEDVDRLVSWLRDQGYQFEKVTPDGSGVYATAPISDIQDSLQVTMVPVTKDGVTYPGAQNAPSLPSDVGAPVTAIVGLQPYRRLNKHFRATSALTTVNRSTLAADGSATPNIRGAPPYFPSELLTAYGAAGQGLTGQDQTIAILIDTAPAESDLEAFWKAAGVPAAWAQVKIINVGGGALPPQEGEETLDVSWTSGIAPGASIHVYCCGALSFTALDMAIDQIIEDLPNTPGLNQVSISLGLGEQYMVKDEVAVQHLKFLKLAAAGVNVFVSTGDAGSNPDTTGHSPTGPLQAEYESTDPAVIAVGGTTLRLARDGTIGSETAWASGGGGRSTLFATQRPAWQTGTGVPTGHDRVVPDVCAAADPNTGAFLVLHGKAIGIGGTSWSAPVWAGLCALINEARAKAHAPALPYLNPQIYPLLGGPAFHDVTAGSNGAYKAGPGYDLVTGLGSPNLAQLVTKLTPRAPAAVAEELPAEPA